MTLYETTFEKINSRVINKAVKFTAQITKVEKPELKINMGAFECKNCMRIHEVPQYSYDFLQKPAVCNECGGRSFKLRPDKSTFHEVQFLTVGSSKTAKQLKIALRGVYASYDNYCIGDSVSVEGLLEVTSVKNNNGSLLLDCLHIQTESEKETSGADDSSEFILNDWSTGQNNRQYNKSYKKWKKTVHERDHNRCVVCGSDKNIIAHHLFRYENYPALKHHEGNGVSMCVACHNEFHREYAPKETTPANLIQFMNKWLYDKVWNCDEDDLLDWLSNQKVKPIGGRDG